MGLNEAEVLKVFSVRSCEVKVCGNVAAQPIESKFEFRDFDLRRGHLYLLEVISVCVAIKKFLHPFQLLTLSLSEVVFVCRATVEGQ